MWEAIKELGQNKLVLLFVTGVFITAIYMIKKGYFKFKGKGVTIGETVPRELIRNQWEYAQSACDAQFAKIRPYCESDTEAKYLICKVNDIFQAAVIYNYMTSSESYVKAKQALVLNAIQKRTSNAHFFSEEFRACCNRFVENTIRDLVRMKQIAEK